MLDILAAAERELPSLLASLDGWSTLNIDEDYGCRGPLETLVAGD